ncbi:MAG: hypothetical protein Q9166_002649 [cf. Caloplaca sp. 2 TL-2023]
MSEAGPAMKWANTYDRNAIRAKYLGDEFAGRGSATDLATGTNGTNASVTSANKREQLPKAESYGFPSQADNKDRALPALPPQSPEPAAPLPLPMTPARAPSNQATVEAAEVPLPATTPGETRAIDRKPLPTAEQAAQVPLPATTPMETDKPLPPTTDGTPDEPAAADPESSPESKKIGGKKLKRKETGALRSLFGRNKSVPALPASPQPADSAAVAAARAALTGTSPKANYVAPDAPKNLSRRFSGIGRKKSPAVPHIASPSVPDIKDKDRPPSPPMYQPQPRIADRYDPKSRVVNAQHSSSRFDSQASISRVSSEVQRNADGEFDRFHQGPIDQPAFVPEDSPPQSTRASTRTATPTEQRMSSRVSSDSGTERPPSPAQDRWAQIRKNAAERAAAAQKEQQAGRASGAERSDDGEGETSGEESKFVGHLSMNANTDGGSY